MGFYAREFGKPVYFESYGEIAHVREPYMYIDVDDDSIISTLGQGISGSPVIYKDLVGITIGAMEKEGYLVAYRLDHLSTHAPQVYDLLKRQVQFTNVPDNQ